LDFAAAAGGADDLSLPAEPDERLEDVVAGPAEKLIDRHDLIILNEAERAVQIMNPAGGRGVTRRR